MPQRDAPAPCPIDLDHHGVAAGERMPGGGVGVGDGARDPVLDPGGLGRQGLAAVACVVRRGGVRMIGPDQIRSLIARQGQPAAPVPLVQLQQDPLDVQLRRGG